MALNILKRTRTLTDSVYSDWSAWSATTDAAPYVDTELIEYRVDTALDASKLSSIHNVLSTEVNATLDGQWEKSRLRGVEYANVVAQSIVALLNTSSQIVLEEAKMIQNQPVVDAQASLIKKQIDTEIAKKSLTERQTVAYDDQLRIEEAKSLANVTGMFGAGGTALPNGLETTMLNAIAAITPLPST